ncbi:MAG: DUF418 domain-containing protein [Bacteroidota bacterium]
MTIPGASSPTSSRLPIVDILRGFALIGVLFANFTAYTDQQVPTEILDSISNSTDRALMAFNSVFVEFKFVTIFSVLFGYSFGLFMDSAAKKTINTRLPFFRRMLSLFVIGVIHTMFWWFDVLHIYAICGLFLLAFRKASPTALIIWAIILIFFIPFVYSFITRNHKEPLSNNDWHQIYMTFKSGDVLQLIKANITGYWRLFILSGANIYYFAEVLGKFLLGYFLFRTQAFDAITTKKVTVKKIAIVCGSISILYFVTRFYALKNSEELDVYYIEPFIKLGVLATSGLYASLLILVYISKPGGKVFNILQSLGRMTLTNYLLISCAMIFLLYGIGFGLLGEVPITIIWSVALAWLFFEIVVSSWWLRNYKYGPVEGLWRKLTWGFDS